jgi:hypothetical protein
MQISLITVKRDPAYLRLASDLRFEAKRAELGQVVDEVRGIPAGKDYGSYHEEGLKTDPAYRAAYAKAMFETADLAEIRGELGSPQAREESTANRGVLTTVIDPHTGEPISVQRSLEDSQLNRARYANADPITDLQWLAGTQYEADCSGEVPYQCNAALILNNGNFRMQAEGAESASDSTGEIFDGEELISYDPSGDMAANASRLARVTRGLTQDERTTARRWICEHKTINASNIKVLLDKLVSLYSAHDDRFAFDAWRHNLTTFPALSEAANDNRAPRARRKSKRG